MMHAVTEMSVVLRFTTRLRLCSGNDHQEDTDVTETAQT
jgi:hypothetical protein